MHEYDLDHWAVMLIYRTRSHSWQPCMLLQITCVPSSLLKGSSVSPTASCNSHRQYKDEPNNKLARHAGIYTESMTDFIMLLLKYCGDRDCIHMTISTHRSFTGLGLLNSEFEYICRHYNVKWRLHLQRSMFFSFLTCIYSGKFHWVEASLLQGFIQLHTFTPGCCPVRSQFHLLATEQLQCCIQSCPFCPFLDIKTRCQAL